MLGWKLLLYKVVGELEKKTRIYKIYYTDWMKQREEKTKLYITIFSFLFYFEAKTIYYNEYYIAHLFG